MLTKGLIFSLQKLLAVLPICRVTRTRSVNYRTLPPPKVSKFLAIMLLEMVMLLMRVTVMVTMMVIVF